MGRAKIQPSRPPPAPMMAWFPRAESLGALSRTGGPKTWDFVPGSDARREIPSTATERVDEAPTVVADGDLPDQMRAAG
jgi:hypothetical protein